MVAMAWTKREETIWEDLQDWRQSLFEYDTTDLENTYDQWMNRAFSLLPEQIQIQFVEKVDGWLFHLNSLLRGTSLQTDASERILHMARAMNDQIHSLSDMKKMPVDQLTFLAEQHATRHRLYSFVQGGMTGAGKAIWIGSDFLATLVINLRAVQLTAMSFGDDVQSPASLFETLKIFHTAILPDRIKMFGWEELVDDLQKGDKQFYYHEHGHIIDQSWVDELLKHLLKIWLIVTFSKRKVFDLPIVSMAIGAGANYKLTRKVTDFSLRYYQYKHLLLKSGKIE